MVLNVAALWGICLCQYLETFLTVIAWRCYWHLIVNPRVCFTAYGAQESPHNRGVLRASLVAQWLRIWLAMQGMLVRALVPEDSTCCRATRATETATAPAPWRAPSHSCWGWPSLEPVLGSKSDRHKQRPTHATGESPGTAAKAQQQRPSATSQ